MTLYVLIGAPASGKSTLARQLQERLPLAVTVCPNQIREAHPGWGSQAFVFAVAHDETHKALQCQRSVIFDATNTIPEERRQVVVIGRHYQADIMAVVMDTPVSLCLGRHDHRVLNYSQRTLTRDAIERYCELLRRYPPAYDEGFNRIVMLTPDTPNPIDTILNLSA